MKKALAAIILLSLCFLTACGGDDIVGTWEYKSGGVAIATYTFNEDGTGIMVWADTKESFEWSISRNELTFVYSGKDRTETVPYTLEEDTLTIGTEMGGTAFTKKNG